MKKLLITSLLFPLSLSVFAQKSVEDIKVFTHWSSYDSDSDSWGAWKANDEVFILNYKDENKIARCRIGSKIILLKVKEDVPIQKGKTVSGYAYTSIRATGDFFQPYTLKFYKDHPDFGLELETGAVRLRFAKK